jgi:hypothetical protein
MPTTTGEVDGRKAERATPHAIRIPYNRRVPGDRPRCDPLASDRQEPDPTPPPTADRLISQLIPSDTPHYRSAHLNRLARNDGLVVETTGFHLDHRSGMDYHTSALAAIANQLGGTEPPHLSIVAGDTNAGHIGDTLMDRGHAQGERFARIMESLVKLGYRDAHPGGDATFFFDRTRGSFWAGVARWIGKSYQRIYRKPLRQRLDAMLIRAPDDVPWAADNVEIPASDHNALVVHIGVSPTNRVFQPAFEGGGTASGGLQHAHAAAARVR